MSAFSARVPRDPEDPRWAVAFSLHPRHPEEGGDSSDRDVGEAMRAFFNEYGFVVVKDVFSAAECDRTRHEIWSHLERDGQLKRDQPETWDKWPANTKPKYGMVSHTPVFSACALSNRQNANLFRAHAHLLGTEDLLCSQDRLGLMLPTKGVLCSDGTTQDMPRWKTAESLHVDLDPYRFYETKKQPAAIQRKLSGLRYSDTHDFITENNVPLHSTINGGLHLQTIINLSDNEEQDGGLQLVPRFHHQFEAWTASLKVPEGKDDADAGALSIYPFPQGHGLRPCRVPSREGSVVIWDARLAHGSRANNSAHARFVQFIKVFPRTNLPQQCTASANRSKALAAHVRRAQEEDPSFVLTDVGRRMFGL
jgi:hypothetical protein